VDSQPFKNLYEGDTCLYPFLESFGVCGPGRRLFITEEGFMGVGPSTTQPGDSVYLLKGAWAPYIF
jgi:hypothetical protein